MTFDRVKAHFEKHKFAYGLGTGIAIAGVVGVATKGGYGGIAIGSDTIIVRPISFFSKQIVTVINANRQGPPSWVVKCLETGEIFSSQRAAALANGINQSDLSAHLNGMHDHVKDLHFARLALAA